MPPAPSMPALPRDRAGIRAAAIWQMRGRSQDRLAELASVGQPSGLAALLATASRYLIRAFTLMVKLGGVPLEAAIVPLGLRHTERTAGS